jgi:hypothetical protein
MNSGGYIPLRVVGARRIEPVPGEGRHGWSFGGPLRLLQVFPVPFAMAGGAAAPFSSFRPARSPPADSLHAIDVAVSSLSNMAWHRMQVCAGAAPLDPGMGADGCRPHPPEFGHGLNADVRDSRLPLRPPIDISLEQRNHRRL